MESTETPLLTLCKHFGSCGGCKSQDTPYLEQVLSKELAVKGLFEGSEVCPMIPCQMPWRYRSKMEFTFRQTKEGERFLGLYKTNGRGRVVDIEECNLTSTWFERALSAAKKWWHSTEITAYFPPKNQGALRTLTLRESFHLKEKMVILTVSGEPEYALKEDEIQNFVNCLQESGENLSIYLITQILEKKKPTIFKETHLYGPKVINEKLNVLGNSLSFEISPLSFFQPNTKQAEILYSKALSLCNIKNTDIVYDLYAGGATLGMFASKLANKVISIELNPDAVANAKENILKNKLENIEIIQGDVGSVLSELQASIKPDLVIVDPPRPGLGNLALEQLITLKCPSILYISCNPETQAKDIKILQDVGYSIGVIQPVDQFPHTPHIENIVVLHLN